MAASDVVARSTDFKHPYLIALIRWLASSFWTTASVLLHRLTTVPTSPVTAPTAPKPRPASFDHLHPEPTVECVVLHTPENHTLDVIFVHGLYGSLGNTWRQGEWKSKYRYEPVKVPLRRPHSMSDDKTNDGSDDTKKIDDKNDITISRRVRDNKVGGNKLNNNINETIFRSDINIRSKYNNDKDYITINRIIDNNVGDYKLKENGINDKRFGSNINASSKYDKNEINVDKTESNNENNSTYTLEMVKIDERYRKIQNNSKLEDNFERRKESKHEKIRKNSLCCAYDLDLKTFPNIENKDSKNIEISELNIVKPKNTRKKSLSDIENLYTKIDKHHDLENRKMNYLPNNVRKKSLNDIENLKANIDINVNFYKDIRKLRPQDNMFITEKFYNNTLLDHVEIVENYETQAQFVKDLFESENCEVECECLVKKKSDCNCEVKCDIGCGCICDDCYSPCWPRDWIPADYPGARIISINYTSDPYLWRPLWVKESKRMTLHERAEQMFQQLLDLGVGDKPIIWVGHSKGGLFIKKIYCEGYEAYLKTNFSNKTPEEIDNMKNELAFKDKENNINLENNNAFNINSNLSVNNNLKIECDNNCDTLDDNVAYLDNILGESCNIEDKNNFKLICKELDNQNNIGNMDQNIDKNMNISEIVNKSKSIIDTERDKVINIDNNNKILNEIEMNNNGIINTKCSDQIIAIIDEKMTVNKVNNFNENIPVQDKSSEKCEELSRRARVWANSAGFMFYSVPHRGSPLADIKTPITARSIELMEIAKECDLVISLQEQWAQATSLRQPAVRSLVETGSTLMSVLWLRIVSVDSADPGIGTLWGVSVDHREICKPSSRECLLYQELMNLMKTALRNKNV